MGDDHPPAPNGQAPPEASGYDHEPPTNPSRGLPTWAWVIITILLVIVGLPLLAVVALYLFCLFSGPMRF